MANKSQFIKNGSNNNVSKLIKAMKGWDGTFYTDPPKGIFGSVAIIKSNGAVINAEDLDIEFTIPFDDDLEPNQVEIVVYNLSDTTVSKLQKKKQITVTAGFKGDTGVVFSGYIEKITTKNENVGRVTTIQCADKVSTTELKDITYKANTKASVILKDLLKKTGTPIAVFKIRRDHTYKDEQKVDGNLLENIKKYADVCGISVYNRDGKIYARYLKEGDNLNFTIEENTGMIGSPQEYEEEINHEDGTETIKGYEIETLLQHRFKAGGKINLNSRDAKGMYRIRSGEHVFRQGEATSRIKVF